MIDDTEAACDDLSWVDAIEYYNETKPEHLSRYKSVQTFTNHMKDVALYVHKRGNRTCTTEAKVQRFIAIKTSRLNWYYKPTESARTRANRLAKKLDIAKMLRSGVYCYE